jgi:RHS repeat-associated protein
VTVLLRAISRGTRVAAYHYDAFGTLYGEHPAAGAPQPTVPEVARPAVERGTRYLYTGKRLDPETGHYDYGLRDYASRLARFTTVDPVKDGRNWYAYVGNDPVNFVDPLGLEITVGDGLAYSEKRDTYHFRDEGTVEEKSKLTVTRSGESGQYTDELTLSVGDNVMSSQKVHSTKNVEDPDDKHDFTLPVGNYTGELLDHSWQYNESIRVYNDDVAREWNFMIHPDVVTNPEHPKYPLDYDTPISAGCIITCNRSGQQYLRGRLREFGFTTGDQLPLLIEEKAHDVTKHPSFGRGGLPKWY